MEKYIFKITPKENIKFNSEEEIEDEDINENI